MDKLLLMYWMFSEGHAFTLVVMDWWVGGLCPPQLIIFYVVEYGGNAKQSSITSFATFMFHVPAVSSFYHGRQQSLRCHILSFLSYIITLKIILFNFSEHQYYDLNLESMHLGYYPHENCYCQNRHLTCLYSYVSFHGRWTEEMTSE